MEVYLEKIANVAARDYSASINESAGVGEDITELLSHAGECFRKIYQDIATAKASDPAGLRSKIDAVTTVDKGLQQLVGLDDAAAQPILESMNASLDVLKEQYPDILPVESCLDRGLDDWKAAVARRSALSAPRSHLRPLFPTGIANAGPVR